MSKPENIINPLTGRKIHLGGRTHRKLLRCLETIDTLVEVEDKKSRTRGQRGGSNKVAKQIKEKSDTYFKDLVKKTEKYDDTLIKPATTTPSDDMVIPKSKFHLISSALPPDPKQHSWYHHHAPFSQNMGAYVCLKRDTLQELGTFLRDALFSDIKTH